MMIKNKEWKKTLVTCLILAGIIAVLGGLYYTNISAMKKAGASMKTVANFRGYS